MPCYGVHAQVIPTSADLQMSNTCCGASPSKALLAAPIVLVRHFRAGLQRPGCLATNVFRVVSSYLEPFVATVNGPDVLADWIACTGLVNSSRWGTGTLLVPLVHTRVYDILVHYKKTAGYQRE